ncbi:probable rRNA maturation factor [Rhodovulum sp. ES.010]|uniref:rRNA maturation RNase YbeY n=1 Tax=Rhodovulum sp. ES.010 TaxID=1882821 RepID=UPI00092A3EBB|nr:rRNA maturation RNase YbeY [Rhodovulum sp. ES.010]SIO55472.1 probable rRNA maturation factor [Rhodovulum sp. ES.010]
MIVEIVCEDPRWEAAGLEAVAGRAAEAALAYLGLDPDACEIAVLACDDARIAVLNAEFRGKPAPTNVLSWPAEELAPEEDGAAPLPPSPELPGMDIALGDIAIAYDTCAREAEAQGISFDAHVTHLVVHGCLHLLGYDHTRPQDAALMERREVEILAKLGVADPYG